MTYSRRVTGCECIEALGDVDIGIVDVKPLHFHCSSNVVVPRGMVGGVRVGLSHEIPPNLCRGALSTFLLLVD